jgi:DNA-binding SARP family transcriptional activator
MFELRTLGTIDLRHDDGTRVPEPPRHAKRIALLAYLAAPHPLRFHRRDTLVALLWPDLDASHARGALRHELYELRRALGSEVLRGDGGELVGVDGARIWCDARAFEQAVEGGHLTDALDLVRGPFLPGLHVAAADFDHWLDGTRDRLARRAAEVANGLSARAERCGDPGAAVRWARRWTELAVYDETAWRRLLLLLDRAGDRAGALTAYDALVDRLSEDLGTDPSAETRSLVERIRGRQTSPAAAMHLPDGTGTVPASTPVVIVLRPAENLTGDARSEALCRRLTDRLAEGLSDLPYLEVVVGTGEIGWATAELKTTLYGRAGRLEAHVRLAEAGPGGRVLATPEPVLLDRDPDDVAVYGVVARVLAASAARYDPRVPLAFVGGAPVRTPAWNSWLEYVQGSEAFGALRFEEAARRLRRAHEIDPKFVKAGVFAAIAMAYAGDPAGAEDLTRAAVEAGETTASDYERHFADWFLAELRGRRPDAYRACRRVIELTEHPVWFAMLGREAYWLNRPAEAVPYLEGAFRGVGWWRNWLEMYVILGGAHHLLENHHAELEAVLGGRALFPERLEPILGEARARAALGEPRAALGLVEEALSLAPGMWTPAEVAWTVAQELDEHGHADAAAEARTAGLKWLSGRTSARPDDRALEVRLLLETGDVAEAARRLAGSAPLEDLEVLGVAGLVAAAEGDREGACEVLNRLEGLASPYLGGRHLIHAAGVRVALGQPEHAVDTLRRAFAAGAKFGAEYRAVPMLQPLAERPDFRALLRPRG